jgi:hypothetical protein
LLSARAIPRLFVAACVGAALAFGFAVIFAAPARACPFCNAVKPTLAQARDAATAAFIAEAGALDSTTGGKQAFLLHTALAAPQRWGKLETLRVTTDGPLKEGTLALLLGNGAADSDPERLQWTAVALDEASCAYVVRAPILREPPAKRLAYFAKYLEHANRLIAADSFLEFAHASFDDTVQAVPSLRMTDLRAWLVDKNVPPERKGFYGLALGLAATPDDRRQNEELLRGQILAPAVDFRAGFDGILGGYLLLTGPRGLELVESRYLANPQAANGDVRHAMRALRFYHEYGHGIPPLRQSEALAHVLDRPEFAAEAITDLARWQYWIVLPRLADLYQRKAYADPLIGRAIVGYLRVCPQAEAAKALEHLRRADPQGIADAEHYWEVFSSGK